MSHFARNGWPELSAASELEAVPLRVTLTQSYFNVQLQAMSRSLVAKWRWVVCKEVPGFCDQQCSSAKLKGMSDHAASCVVLR